MKRFLFIFLLNSSLAGFAQEMLMPAMPEQDSSMIATERMLMYNQLLMGTVPSGEWMQPLPLIKMNFAEEALKFRSFSFFENYADMRTFERLNFGMPGALSHPFLLNTNILSGSEYRINNHFMLGGYSFEGRSPFTAPFPNQGLNNYDVRGSTLFMKYNVSKNFKIETRVNVIQGPGYP